MIGKSTRRVEDPILLRGQGRFAADLPRPGQLHMRMVRSPVAHGRIRSIDTRAALAQPGVVAVWTHADIADLPPISFRLTPLESMLPYRQPVLARERVRYVGEPVAVVFADSEYAAEDAAELVEVDVEALPAIIDPTGERVEWLDESDVAWTAPAAADGRGRDNESATINLEYGDTDAAFAAAAHVFEIDVRVGRHSGVPMECRGASAYVDPATGVLMVNGAAKVPFWNRDAIARMIGWSPHQVQLTEGHVGGGFGPRGELYPEDVLLTLAAVRLARPVRWIEDRQEHLVSCNHSRDQRHRIRAAVDESGLITALDAEFWADQGAYARTHGATVASLTASMLPGPYLLPNYRVVGHVRMSNKTPAGTYRSPGRYEGTFARERLVDAIAHGLGIDRIDLRRRNFIPVDAMPYQRPIQAMGTELVYDSGDYHLLMDKVEDTFDLPALRAEVEQRRAAGELVGIGYGWFVEKSGLGPSEGARISVDTGGSALVTTGASSVGQGVDTVLSQIASEVLGVEMERIRTVRGQTEQFGYGRGAFATRQSVMVGNAVLESALAVRAKAVRVAAHHLEIDQADLELVAGRVQVVGNPQTGLDLAEIAQLLEPHQAKAIGEEPGLTCDGWFHTDHMTYPYGVHVAVVSLDRGTGKPNLERFIVGYDVGKALNHTLVEGQITGGAAQGIGGALYEEFRYAEDGQPQATTFMDYLMPTMAEMPRFGVLVTEDAPSPLNPLGVKGAGEGGTTATAAAIASAVDDALSRPGSVVETPIRPDQIRRLIARADHEHSPNQKEN